MTAVRPPRWRGPRRCWPEVPTRPSSVRRPRRCRISPAPRRWRLRPGGRCCSRTHRRRWVRWSPCTAVSWTSPSRRWTGRSGPGWAARSRWRGTGCCRPGSPCSAATPRRHARSPRPCPTRPGHGAAGAARRAGGRRAGGRARAAQRRPGRAARVVGPRAGGRGPAPGGSLLAAAARRAARRRRPATAGGVGRPVSRPTRGRCWPGSASPRSGRRRCTGRACRRPSSTGSRRRGRAATPPRSPRRRARAGTPRRWRPAPRSGCGCSAATSTRPRWRPPPAGCRPSA